MLRRWVYLTTLFLGRLSLLSGLTSICAHSFTRNWQLPFLNQWRGKNDSRKYFMKNDAGSGRDWTQDLLITNQTSIWLVHRGRQRRMKKKANRRHTNISPPPICLKNCRPFLPFYHSPSLSTLTSLYLHEMSNSVLGKNKENITKLSSAELAKRVEEVKENISALSGLRKSAYQ